MTKKSHKQRQLEALEHQALAEMKARATYNAIVKREADTGRDVSKFPTYRLQPSRRTRRRITALRRLCPPTPLSISNPPTETPTQTSSSETSDT